MESLFDKNTYNSIKARLNKLDSDSTQLWGKMDVAQMLQHCTRTFGYALATNAAPRSLFGVLVGWMFKKSLYNNRLWKQGLPTAPHLRVAEPLNVNAEKKRLNETIDEFFNRGPEKTGMFTHPVFGNFTKDQWGMMCFKHLDHHFRQFGV